MKSKKAQGLPINVIIIAVIALILLVVILAITTGKLKVFGKGTANCKAQGGDCKTKEECIAPKYTTLDSTNCKDESPDKPICCIALY